MIDIDAISMSISSDEDSYCFSFQAEITRPEDFNLFNPDTEVRVLFYGTAYEGIVDERKRTTVFGERKYNINGRAITCKLGSGKSNTISRDWVNILASDVVAELCAEVGVTSNYQAYDWVIPKLSASNEYRIDVIKRIATACGAIVQTTHNGILTIIPKYKQSPTQFFQSGFTPDVIYGQRSDIISLSENYQVYPKYNEVIVMDLAEANEYYSIFVIDTDQLRDLSGEVDIGVKVFPFKDSLSLNTSSNAVTISYLGKVQVTEEDEIVEIIHGEGSAKELVKSITSSEYLTNNLGSIHFTGTSISTDIKGQSLIRMTYVTEYHKFNVRTTTIEDPFQLYTLQED